MSRILTLFVVAALLPAVVSADTRPAQGRLLVATDVVHGELFAKTVVLLLHYDDTGAFGLVINRPTEVEPRELLGDDEAAEDYRGTFYWGGPVQMDSLRALMRTDEPPHGAEKIVESVYLVAIEDALEQGAMEASSVRLLIGYAGWAPGQLDYEMGRGSWRVVPATAELVFAEEPSELWKRLAPAQEQRAAVSRLRVVKTSLVRAPLDAGDEAACSEIEIPSEVRAQFAHVVPRAVDEARFASAQVGQTEYIQPRGVDDAAVVSQVPLAIERRNIEP